MCVLSVLDCTTLEFWNKVQVSTSKSTSTPSRHVSMYDIDGPMTDVELSKGFNGRLMVDFDQQIISSASTLVEDQNVSDFKSLSNEAYEMPGLS